VKGGRLEGRITFTSNVSANFTDSVGTGTVMVVAGNYFMSELIEEVSDQLNGLAGTSGDINIVLSGGESGTGRVTLGAGDSYPLSVTWTSTPLRDTLGFTGNIVAAMTAQTGAQCARPLWIPGQVKQSMYGDASFTTATGLPGFGSLVTDLVHTVGPTGRVYSLKSQEYREHRGVAWQGIARARALRQYESVVGESFESFYLDVAAGRVSTYVPLGTPIRFYPDADAVNAPNPNAAHVDGRVLWPDKFDLVPMVANWMGRWNIELPTLVVETA
jgi:hypothetical protein